jgi:hypothetical protein
MKKSPACTPKKHAQAFAGGTGLGQRMPYGRTRVGPLHGDHRQVAPRRQFRVDAPFRQFRCHPAEVLCRGGGIDDDAIARGVTGVDDEVVHHAAALVEHDAVKRLAGLGQPVDVVGEETAQESPGIGAGDIQRAHVRHVEHAAVAAHRVVLLDLRAVVQRHVPSAEIDHARAQAAVHGVEDGCLHCCTSRQ